MNWFRKPQPTKSIRIGNRGILTVPDTYTGDELRQLVHQFQQALRTSRLIVTEPGIAYAPLPPRRRIRLANAERWLTA